MILLSFVGEGILLAVVAMGIITMIWGVVYAVTELVDKIREWRR